jgi:hypothetical protein
MGNELAVIGNQTSLALADVMQIGRVMSESGFFSDSRSAAQAVVKILAGQELGFGPFASMTGIHIIQGRPSVGANLMASAVKRNGRYNYRVTKMDDSICDIEFYEHGEAIGSSSFTVEDAKRAGTQNMGKFPRNMLFARAMSNGVRWYCPDTFNGSAVYTPEELGAVVDEDGQVIQINPSPGQVAPERTPAPKADEYMGGVEGEIVEPFQVGDAVMVHGKHDEKEGTVKAVNGLITVEVGGKEIKVAADKLTLVPVVAVFTDEQDRKLQSALFGADAKLLEVTQL